MQYFRFCGVAFRAACQCTGAPHGRRLRFENKTPSYGMLSVPWKIILVMDNMNIHVLASLYKCFPVPGACSYAKRLENFCGESRFFGYSLWKRSYLPPARSMERYCIACVKTRRNNIAYKERIMCDSVKLAVIAREEGKTVQREIK